MPSRSSDPAAAMESRRADANPPTATVPSPPGPTRATPGGTLAPMAAAPPQRWAAAPADALFPASATVAAAAGGGGGDTTTAAPPVVPGLTLPPVAPVRIAVEDLEAGTSPSASHASSRCSSRAGDVEAVQVRTMEECCCYVCLLGDVDGHRRWPCLFWSRNMLPSPCSPHAPTPHSLTHAHVCPLLHKQTAWSDTEVDAACEDDGVGSVGASEDFGTSPVNQRV